MTVFHVNQQRLQHGYQVMLLILVALSSLPQWNNRLHHFVVVVDDDVVVTVCMT